MHHRTYIGNPVAVLSSAEEEKKRKYNSAAEARRASFTPLVVSSDGMLGREADFLVKSLAQGINIKWEKPLGQDSCMQSCLLQYFEQQIFICMVLAPSGEGMDDGAGLPAELLKSN